MSETRFNLRRPNTEPAGDVESYVEGKGIIVASCHCVRPLVRGGAVPGVGQAGISGLPVGGAGCGLSGRGRGCAGIQVSMS